MAAPRGARNSRGFRELLYQGSAASQLDDLADAIEAYGEKSFYVGWCSPKIRCKCSAKRQFSALNCASGGSERRNIRSRDSCRTIAHDPTVPGQIGSRTRSAPVRMCRRQVRRQKRPKSAQESKPIQHVELTGRWAPLFPDVPTQLPQLVSRPCSSRCRPTSRPCRRVTRVGLVRSSAKKDHAHRRTREKRGPSRRMRTPTPRF